MQANEKPPCDDRRKARAIAYRCSLLQARSFLLSDDRKSEGRAAAELLAAFQEARWEEHAKEGRIARVACHANHPGCTQGFPVVGRIGLCSS